MELLTKRYKGQIAGVLCCYDRIIMQGTVPKWCYAKGMTDYFYEHQIRIFDYPKWAEPLRDAIRQNLERIAAESGTEIVFVRSKKKFRQEKHVRMSDQCWTREGKNPESCGSSRRWSPAAPTSRGMTRRPTRRT